MFYIWQRVRNVWRKLRNPRLVVHLEPDDLAALQRLAWQHHKSTHDFAVDVLVGTAEKLDTHDVTRSKWETLTTRQQQITALICLGYTNPQIAAKLHLSVPTIKTHVQNIFHKFDISRRVKLANLLSAWDFQDLSDPK